MSHNILNQRNTIRRKLPNTNNDRGALLYLRWRTRTLGCYRATPTTGLLYFEQIRNITVVMF